MDYGVPMATPASYHKDEDGRNVATLTYVPPILLSPNVENSIVLQPSAIWTPVGKMTWSWSASATWNAGMGLWYLANGSDDSDLYLVPPDKGPLPTNDFPVWATSVAKQGKSGWVTTP